MIEKSLINDIIANPYNISELEFHIVSQILHQAVDILKEETLLLELNVNASDMKVFIVGDIHGNLKSLQKLFGIIEQEKPKFVIFLGDIVDRGPYQLECLIFILALKIQHADKYFLLKGNHESLEINQHYDFYQDFINRFKEQRNFENVLGVYKVLPICALVNKVVLCLHGGIPEDIDILKKLKGIKTGDLTSVDIGLTKSLMQIMWNDPKSKLNGFSDSFRGIDIKNFGEDVFTDFMRENSLDYLIRSHEIFPEGYKWFFNKQLLSIFSSANYRGKNPASYAVIKKDSVQPKLID